MEFLMGNITEAEIINAAKKLIANGETLSLNRIREITGHGSYATIKAVLENNRIKTPRLAKHDYQLKSNSNQDISRMLYDLGESIAALKNKIQLQEKKIQELQNYQVLAKYFYFWVLTEIVKKHLKIDSELVEFTKMLEPEKILSSQITEFTKDTLRHMTDLLLSDFVARIDNIQDVSEFAGGENSLNAMKRMLIDLKRKKHNYDQAYYY